MSRQRESPVAHDLLVVLLAVAAGIPGVAVALVLIWTGDLAARVQWTLSVLIAGSWVGGTIALRERVVRPLQTLSNMLAALGEGDYSIRARGAKREDALGLAMFEVNQLGTTLREQRLDALEATALLRKVMAEIDVAVFAFDSENRLALANRAGERLLKRSSPKLLARSAEELGLADFLRPGSPPIADRTFPGGSGRWELRRTTFRQGGRPHQLLVLTDLSRALREEERQAWKRLIRVLGHEINNSLAPIKSIAGSLQRVVVGPNRTTDWEDDLASGLNVIGGRAEALSRFMASYAQLARLPAPEMRTVDVREWVERVVALETRMRVAIESGPDVTVQADGDQLDQLLINLVGNAVDAALETQGGVSIGWRAPGVHVEVWVTDEGPGLSTTSNLFVPFFTTKKKGSGIGLVLSRQIAEAHGGTLTLANRPRATGCEARLRLPRRAHAA